MFNDRRHIRRLYLKIYDRIMKNIPYASLNGDKEERFEGNMSFTFQYVSAEDLGLFKEIAFSKAETLNINCLS